MNDINRLAYLINATIVSEERNYWLVRTVGGKYYYDFKLNDYIAIDWNEISDLELIKPANRNKLKKKISERCPREEMPGAVANQLIRFVDEMKKGDIVIIPSQNSENICFGELLEDDIYILTNEQVLKIAQESTEPCPFRKRRRVEWIKTIKRERLDPYLYKLMNSHHTITKANDYAHYIDRTLYPVFIKGDKAHITFEVTETHDIAAIDLISFINNTLSALEVYNTITNSELSKQDVDLKINVQSPGTIEFFGKIEIIAVIAFLTVLVCGGGARFKTYTDGTCEGEVTSDGFIEKLIKLIDHLHQNKMDMLKLQDSLNQSAEKINVKFPGEEDINESNEQLDFFNDKDVKTNKESKC